MTGANCVVQPRAAEPDLSTFSPFFSDGENGMMLNASSTNRITGRRNNHP